MTRKSFTHKDGSVSILQIPDSFTHADLRVEDGSGETVEKVITSNAEWKKLTKKAKDGQK